MLIYYACKNNDMNSKITEKELLEVRLYGLINQYKLTLQDLENGQSEELITHRLNEIDKTVKRIRKQILK